MGPGENSALVASDPEAYFLPPYVARHGYVGVYLDRPGVDCEEIDELVVDAYRLVAPASLRARAARLIGRRDPTARRPSTGGDSPAGVTVRVVLDPRTRSKGTSGGAWGSVRD